MNHNHNVRNDDNRFIIDGESREITNLSGHKPVLQQFDHNSEVYEFELPRYIEGHDMSLTDLVCLHYDNTSSGTSRSTRIVNGGMDKIEDLAIDPENEDRIAFTWTVPRSATQQAGTLVFQFQFVCYGEDYAETGEPAYEWYSGIYSFAEIKKSLNKSQSVVIQSPDIIIKMNQQIDALEEKTADIDGLAERTATLEDQVADLMYEKIGPMAISSFTNNVNTVEIGSTVTDVAFSWTLNRTPVSVTFDGEAQENSKKGSATRTGLAITADHSWTLRAVDERDAVATKTTAVYFRNGIYYGVGAIDDVIGAETLSLSKTLSNTKGRTFTVNAGEGQYIWYIIPERLGACKFVVGGFEGGFTIHQTVDYTNPSGWTEKYIFYRSVNADLGDTTVTVS